MNIDGNIHPFLLVKRRQLGTVLAFMVSVIALLLPKMVILSKVLKPRLIATFIAVVGFGILFIGSVLLLLVSLGISLVEIFLSVDAISIELRDFEKRIQKAKVGLNIS